MNFEWASNPRKVERAIAALKTEGKEVTEEAVKELYIKYGGLVLETGAPAAQEEAAPARRGRKTDE